MPLRSLLDWALLQRLTGRASEADEQIVRGWAADDPRRLQILDELDRVWPALDRERTVRDDAWRDQAWRAVAMRMADDSREHIASASSMPRVTRARVEKLRTRAVRWPIRIAATLAGLVAVTLFTVKNSERWVPARAEKTYTTAVRQRATIRLTDGSQVILAPGSRLTIGDGFGRAHRTIELAGQAFFDVVPMPGAVFAVRTGAVSTEVLGTAFDVRHYPGDTTVRVVVASGKVRSGAPRRRAITLGVGMIAYVTDSTARTTMDGESNISAAMRWKDGQLEFRNTPVPEALEMLGRWYGVHLRVVDSSLKAERLSGLFDYRSTVNMMEALKMLLDVQLTIEGVGDGRIVTLHPAHTRTRTLPRTILAPLSSPTEKGR